MTEFPLRSSWGSPEQQQGWAEVLRRTGPENVRARLAQIDAGSPAAMSISTEQVMTKGFAEEWLAHQDAQRLRAEERHRAYVAKWTRAAAIGAVAAAEFACIGVVAAICQAVFAYMALPK